MIVSIESATDDLFIHLVIYRRPWLLVHYKRPFIEKVANLILLCMTFPPEWLKYLSIFYLILFEGFCGKNEQAALRTNFFALFNVQDKNRTFCE